MQLQVHLHPTSPAHLHHQELRCREEELKQAALEQKSHEEFLRQREQQLAQWEQDVFERELSLLILHLNQNQEKPNVKKRKGTFKKHKLKSKNGEKISMPQGAFDPPSGSIKKNNKKKSRVGKGSKEKKFYDATAGSNCLCALQKASALYHHRDWCRAQIYNRTTRKHTFITSTTCSLHPLFSSVCI